MEEGVQDQSGVCVQQKWCWASAREAQGLVWFGVATRMRV